MKQNVDFEQPEPLLPVPIGRSETLDAFPGQCESLGPISGQKQPVSLLELNSRLPFRGGLAPNQQDEDYSGGQPEPLPPPLPISPSPPSGDPNSTRTIEIDRSAPEI